MSVTIEHRSRPCVGEQRSGDAVVVSAGDTTFTIAVVDALGHGPTAADVAEQAVSFLEENLGSRNVETIMQGLHDSLRGTRGAAAFVCVLDDRRLSACSVGNVDMKSLGSRVPVVLSPGILGVNVRRMRVFEATIEQSSRLAIFSDGISTRFALEEAKKLDPDAACTWILESYAYEHDDATVLVADVEV